MNLSPEVTSLHHPELLERCCDVLSERFGTRDWSRVPGELKARKSTTLFLHSSNMDRRVALRVYANPQAALQQARALRHGALLGGQGEGFDMPDLYAEFESDSALLIEWVALPHLEQVLVRAAAFPRAHWRAVRATGAWLRRFHELDGITTGNFDANRYHGLMESRCVRAPLALAALSGDRIWQNGLAAFHAALAGAEGQSVPVALLHGDFTSTNILVGPVRVTGIDAWAENRLPVIEDLARMVIYLAMGDPLPLRARLRPVAIERRRGQRALLEGYGTDLVRAPAPWRAMLLFESLARWLAIEDRLVRRANLPEQWKRGGLRGLVRSLIVSER